MAPEVGLFLFCVLLVCTCKYGQNHRRCSIEFKILVVVMQSALADRDASQLYYSCRDISGGIRRYRGDIEPGADGQRGW